MPSGDLLALDRIASRPLPYVERLQRRDPSDIELAVIHATELPDLATAREFGERIHYPASGTGNSGHFYIDRDGAMEQWVPVERMAHHVADLNARSIGIELVNLGRYPDWHDSRHQAWQEACPEAQLAALIALLNELETRLPGLKNIAGHDQLDTRWIEASDDPGKSVRRKLDPGPDFPWPRLLEAINLKQLG